MLPAYLLLPLLAVLLTEFCLVEGLETGDNSGMTNGSWISEVKVRKAILLLVFVCVCVCIELCLAVLLLLL